MNMLGRCLACVDGSPDPFTSPVFLAAQQQQFAPERDCLKNVTFG